jgi:predicted nucleotidyltransferase
MVKKINDLKKNSKKLDLTKFPTLEIKTERDIAADFAEKVYRKFSTLVKSVILFGSSAKHTNIAGSDIDVIIIIDNASIKFDESLIFWYREELGKIIQTNPYKQDLHINTIKLTTWWEDLSKGDPTLINILRYGEALIDFGGFFNPLKMLLQEGKITATPESIYSCLQRVPMHIASSRNSELGAIEGVYWAMSESSQALLMSIRVIPPSPEHIAILLKENFVDKGLLKLKYVVWYRDLYDLHRKIVHGEIKNIDGRVIDEWQSRAEEFFKIILKLIDEII